MLNYHNKASYSFQKNRRDTRAAAAKPYYTPNRALLRAVLFFRFRLKKDEWFQTDNAQ